MHTALLTLPLLTAAALCQLPAPTLQTRVAPRAAWTAVPTSGTCTLSTATTTGSFRADTPGASDGTRIWVFGGCKDNNTANTYNDLWVFDSTTETYAQVIADQAAGSPHARGRHSAAWSPAAGKLYVFGGNNRNTGPDAVATLRNDIWEYDPVANSWTDVTPLTGLNPSVREFASIAYEPATGGILMFGGRSGTLATDAPNDETWLFLNGSWILLSSGVGPAPRMQHSLVTRSDVGDIVLVGGMDQSAGTNIAMLDVWRWDGQSFSWQLLNDGTVTWPHGTIAAQGVYDLGRQRLVWQGGQGLTSMNSALYGPSYGGSPSNWTSEYDFAAGAWTIYGNPITGTTPWNNNDPAIGRISRYSAGYAGGKVYKIGGQNPALSGSRPSLNAYAYAPTTSASTLAYGAGCTGPGGALSLVSNSNPWTDRTWTGTGAGFGPSSVALFVVGLTQTAVPVSALVPQGALGCDLLNSVDVLSLFLFPFGGQAAASISIPNDRVFAGLSIYAQMAEMELDALGNWVGLYTSNGLTLTIGAL
jgi:hypothetical protein